MSADAGVIPEHRQAWPVKEYHFGEKKIIEMNLQRSLPLHLDLLPTQMCHGPVFQLFLLREVFCF